MAAGFTTQAVAGRPGVVYDTAVTPVGTIARTADGKEYIFLSGVAAVIAGSWVTYDEAFAILGLDSDVAASLVGPVAVASAAIVAGKYGWFQIGGSVSAGALTVADNGKVYATSTVFMCDDAAVTGNQVHGAIWRSADSASLATCQLNRPFIGVADAII